MVPSRPSAIAAFGLLAMLGGCGGSGDGASSDVAYAIQCADTTTVRFVEPPIEGERISGLIEIEANARADKDPADLLAEFGGAVLTQPERLPAAVILGGYVSGTAGIHENELVGDFRFPVDSRDRYCIDLEPGQTVNVEFFTPQEGHGVRLTRAVDAKDIATSRFDTAPAQDEPHQLSLTLPPDQARGTYVVSVEAPSPSGPTRYVLASSPTGRATNLHWQRNDFRPGEAVVTLNRNVSSTSGQSSQPGNAVSALSLDEPLGNGQYKMVMPLGASTFSAGQAQPATVKRDTLAWIQQLRRRPEVASASPNYLFKGMAAFESVSEPLYPAQWHYPLINVPQAWQLAPEGGAGVSVAVLDTGIFRDGEGWHEDLVASLPSRCDTSTCFDFIDTDFLPIDPGSALGGSVFHGTHVAATVAASGSNGRGGAGVAPGARLLPVRVLDENGTGDLAGVIEGINWSVENKADIVNLSLGSSADTADLRAAVDNAVRAGVLIVAAAGNSPTPEPVYPAALDFVFGVGAVDGAGVLASYSSRASTVNLVAPGGDAGRDANQDGRADVVVSASGNAETGSTYAGLQGTSMAAPHVAGVFALMRSLNPQLNAPALTSMLADVTTGRSGLDGYGQGLIDAALAVESAAGASLTLLSAQPTLLEFARGEPERVLLLNRVGNGGGAIAANSIAISTPVPWLTVSAPSATASGFQAQVRIDAAALDAARAYRSELTVTYSASGQRRTIEVPVIVPVSSTVAERDAGLHFVLMVATDAAPGAAADAQTALSAVDGGYRFNFGVAETLAEKADNEVLVGESYFLVAGTDLDNDGFICTPGEACAEYPVAGLREPVRVALQDGQAVLLDAGGELIPEDALVMTTSFSRPLSAQSLPRPGFAGYKLLESAPEYAPRNLPD